MLIKEDGKMNNNIEENNVEVTTKINEKIQNAPVIIEKILLIYKRIILGLIITILLINILFDAILVSQTIKARNYVEVEAVYVDKKIDSESSIFYDCVYTFVDKKGVQQEIIVSIPNGMSAEDTIRIRYNENEPQDYYEDGATYDKNEIIWYIIKIIVLVLLIVVFFNKKILSKINISMSKK